MTGFQPQAPLALPLPRLLVVDDQPIHIQLLHQILKDEYQISAATSGERGLELSRQLQPALIIIDVVMPGMDGLSLCRALKADPLTAAIPIILASADQDPLTEREGLNAGAADFVTKPFNATVLRARVRSHLLIRRQSELLAQTALRDEVTGFATPAAFRLAVDQEWRRAQRNQQPMALMALSFTADIGLDQALGARLGQIIKSQLLRPADLAASLDPHHLLCLLPETDLAGTYELAQRLQAAFSAAAAEAPGIGAAAALARADLDWQCLITSAVKAADFSLNNHRRPVIAPPI